MRTYCSMKAGSKNTVCGSKKHPTNLTFDTFTDCINAGETDLCPECLAGRSKAAEPGPAVAEEPARKAPRKPVKAVEPVAAVNAALEAGRVVKVGAGKNGTAVVIAVNGDRATVRYGERETVVATARCKIVAA